MIGCGISHRRRKLLTWTVQHNYVRFIVLMISVGFFKSVYDNRVLLELRVKNSLMQKKNKI